MEAWYFSEDSKKLRFGDAREIAVGVTHTVDAPLALCERGLHASVKAFEALSYSPGPVVWRVRLGGEILTGDDKLCATERTYIAGGVDATEVLRKFSRRVALDVIHLWDAPDVVRKFLETGDESLRDADMNAALAAAWDDASDDALAAAWDDACDDAWAAARNAALAATRATARNAAWDAALATARNAAWDAAWDAALAAARNAAWATARNAAWAAAIEKYNGWLEEMLRELMEGT